MARPKKFSDAQLLDLLEAGNYVARTAGLLSAKLGLKVTEGAVRLRINRLCAVGRIKRKESELGSNFAVYEVNRNWVAPDTVETLPITSAGRSYSKKLFNVHRVGVQFVILSGVPSGRLFQGVRPRLQVFGRNRLRIFRYHWKDAWTLEVFPRKINVHIRYCEPLDPLGQNVWANQRARELAELFARSEGLTLVIPESFKDWKFLSAPEMVTEGAHSEWSKGIIKDLGVLKRVWKPVSDKVEVCEDGSDKGMAEFRPRVGAPRLAALSEGQIWQRVIEQDTPSLVDSHHTILGEVTGSIERIKKILSERGESSVAPERVLPEVKPKDRRELT